MGKVYKGYELYKMIADREIKKDSKFKDNNNIIWVWDGLDFVTEECDYNDFVFSLMEFELIEDEEIDIQNLKGIEKTATTMSTDDDLRIAYSLIHECENKLNEYLLAIKQLDNKMKEK